jgi:hypothetical protein
MILEPIGRTVSLLVAVTGMDAGGIDVGLGVIVGGEKTKVSEAEVDSGALGKVSGASKADEVASVAFADGVSVPESVGALVVAGRSVVGGTLSMLETLTVAEPVGTMVTPVPDAVPEDGSMPDTVVETALVGVSEGTIEEPIVSEAGIPVDNGGRSVKEGTTPVPVGIGTLDISVTTGGSTLETMLDRSGIDVGMIEETMLLTSDVISDTRLDSSDTTDDGSIGIGVMAGSVEVGAVGPGAGSVMPEPELGITPLGMPEGSGSSDAKEEINGIPDSGTLSDVGMGSEAEAVGASDALNAVVMPTIIPDVGKLGREISEVGNGRISLVGRSSDGEGRRPPVPVGRMGSPLSDAEGRRPPVPVGRMKGPKNEEPAVADGSTTGASLEVGKRTDSGTFPPVEPATED